MNISSHLIIASIFLLASWNTEVLGQVECAATGNLRGIRVAWELMACSTSIRAVFPTAADQGQGGRGGGGGGGRFSRDGDALTVTGSLTGGGGRGGGFGGGRGGASVAGVSYRAVFKDAAPGTVDAEIEITTTTNLAMEGVFFTIMLPDADYAGGSAEWISPTSGTEAPVSLARFPSAITNLRLLELEWVIFC